MKYITKIFISTQQLLVSINMLYAMYEERKKEYRKEASHQREPLASLQVNFDPAAVIIYDHLFTSIRKHTIHF